MLKFLIYLIFLIPLCLLNSSWWIIQSLIFILCFLFIFSISGLFYWGNLSYLFGSDLISFGLVLLRLWICTLIIIARESIFRYSYYRNFFLFVVIILTIILYCTFGRLSIFSFYLFFEGSLIPTLFLILGWGYQPERLQAGIYLLFYTLLASLPLLVGIFYVYNFLGLLYIPLLVNDFCINNLFYLCIIMAFLVRIPIFLVHLWLPRAHVEAPVSGSIILAGVLLKLGGYGLLRVFIILIKYSVFNYIWISISLIGGVIVSLICIRQTDLKSLIAYSSVAHIRIVISGIIIINYWGYIGSYILMIGHGLCSSGIFCLANINYERLRSRSLFFNKGIINFIPSLTIWWFLLLSSNISAPPSLNLVGEIRLINRLLRWSWMLIIMLILISFFRAGYSLYLYSYSQHGNFYLGIYRFYIGSSREYLLLSLHWLPLNLLILKIDYFIIWL